MFVTSEVVGRAIYKLFWRRKVLLVLLTFIVGVVLLLNVLLYHAPRLRHNYMAVSVKVENKTVKLVPTKIAQRWKAFNKSSITETGNIFPPDAKVPITVSSSFLIPNEALCSGHLTLTYVVVVHTAPTHFERRANMRGTWAQTSDESRTVFLLGSTTNKTLQTDIFKENEKFGDIVQGSFIDDYKNLTLKAVMGLRWISENCRNAGFVIKVDDDVFVNVPKVMQHVMPLLFVGNKQLVCSVEPHAYIFRNGNPHKQVVKWMVSNDYFKGLTKYPMPFCYGYANFYTTSLAVDLFEMAKSTPLYRLDDVYVYGILASKVQNLTWRNAGSLFYKSETGTMAALKKHIKPLLLVGTANSGSTMRTLWTAVANRTI